MGKKPECRIVYIDVKEKTSRVILHEKIWASHAQIRPFDNNTILFCHEGPADLIDARLWLINSDGSNLRCAKPKKEMNEIVTHEYWLADGSKLAYVYREERESKTSNVMFMDPITLKEEFLTECSKYGHFISNINNSLIVGDGKLEEDTFIFLLDVKDKKEKRLCYHGSSWKGYGTSQDSHPHPAFSPDGKAVVYTSDKDGLPCVYLAEI